MSMREKIARAIDPRPFSLNWPTHFMFETWRVEAETEAYQRADAVLDALMEPTGDMMKEGADASPMWDTRSEETYAIAVNDVADIFAAMVRAAKDGK